MTGTIEPEGKAVLLRIHGTVQGVWYRAWTVQAATEAGLSGWVRNRSDGTVEALIAGPAGAVDAMIRSCRRGPPNALVRDIAVEPARDPGKPGFETLPTL